MRIRDAREEWCAKNKPELQCCRGGEEVTRLVVGMLQVFSFKTFKKALEKLRQPEPCPISSRDASYR